MAASVTPRSDSIYGSSKMLTTFGSRKFSRVLMFGGADHGAEHELEDGLLAEGVGDDLQASSLLEEQALEKIGRSDRAAIWRLGFSPFERRARLDNRVASLTSPSLAEA